MVRPLSGARIIREYILTGGESSANSTHGLDKPTLIIESMSVQWFGPTQFDHDRANA